MNGKSSMGTTIITFVVDEKTATYKFLTLSQPARPSVWPAQRTNTDHYIESHSSCEAKTIEKCQRDVFTFTIQ